MVSGLSVVLRLSKTMHSRNAIKNRELFANRCSYFIGQNFHDTNTEATKVIKHKI